MFRRRKQRNYDVADIKVCMVRAEYEEAKRLIVDGSSRKRKLRVLSVNEKRWIDRGCREDEAYLLMGEQ